MATSELPGNSHQQRTVRSETVTKTTKSAETPEKNIEKVVTTDAILVKPSLGSRFRKTFLGIHAKDAWEFIWTTVLIPYAQDAIVEGVSQGAERMVYNRMGISAPPRRRGSINRGSGSDILGHVSYNRVSDRPVRREEPRRSSRGTHDFDDIVLATRAEADIVIERLYDIVDEYDQATVADLYSLVGVTGSFQDERWGWTDMTGANVRRSGGAYRLVLPSTVPLK